MQNALVRVLAYFDLFLAIACPLIYMESNSGTPIDLLCFRISVWLVTFMLVCASADFFYFIWTEYKDPRMRRAPSGEGNEADERGAGEASMSVHNTQSIEDGYYTVPPISNGAQSYPYPKVFS